MIEISGDFYDNSSSKKKEVLVRFYHDKNVEIIYGKEVIAKISFDELNISSRIANTQRILKTKEFAIYTNENDKIDDILKKFSPKSSLIHFLETNTKFTFLSLIFILLCVVFFLTAGSDFIAKKIAYIVPYSIEKKISDATLDTLDSYFLKKSQLSKEKKAQILKVFYKVTQNDPKYHLYFKRGIGENAFALPSGDIIITDELVKMSDGDMDMIFGVLAHEKAHILYKHSMQMLLKHSLVTALVTYLTGDISTLVTTLSTSLISAGYSRDFEREADRYAKTLMLKNHISPKHLANFFIKMQKKYHNSSLGYFASHPSDEERIKNLLK